MKSTQTGDHEPEIGAFPMKRRERTEQPFEVLVGMQGGDHEQYRLRPPCPRDREELRIHTQRNYANLPRGQAIVPVEIRGCGCRICNDDSRDVRRPEQEEPPEGQIEPAEML